jgi:hypothetical protein
VPISKTALELYNSFKREPIYLGMGRAVVRFHRAVWMHITRPQRSRLLRYQSLFLLGAARKILRITEEEALTLFVSKSSTDGTLLAANAVSFPFRQTAVVKIVLRVDAVKVSSRMRRRKDGQII